MVVKNLCVKNIKMVDNKNDKNNKDTKTTSLQSVGHSPYILLVCLLGSINILLARQAREWMLRANKYLFGFQSMEKRINAPNVWPVFDESSISDEETDPEKQVEAYTSFCFRKAFVFFSDLVFVDLEPSARPNTIEDFATKLKLIKTPPQPSLVKVTPPTETTEYIQLNGTLTTVNNELTTAKRQLDAAKSELTKVKNDLDAANRKLQEMPKNITTNPEIAALLKKVFPAENLKNLSELTESQISYMLNTLKIVIPKNTTLSKEALEALVATSLFQSFEEAFDIQDIPRPALKRRHVEGTE